MPLSLNTEGIPTWRGIALQLPPKERAVLGLLLERHPEPVSKEDIVRHVWLGDAAVSDDSLVRCVTQLRKALPEIRIESVYGYGYRLLGEAISPKNRAAEHEAGPAAAVESFIYATGLMQQVTPSAVRTALRVFKDIVRRYPQYLPARISLAHAFTIASALNPDEQAEGDLDEAWRNLDLAIRSAPVARGLLGVRAGLCDITWRFREADTLYLEAMKKEPENVRIQVFYARHLILLGRAAEAVEVLRRALEHWPNAAYIHVRLAVALSYLQRYQEALDELNLVAGENPTVESMRVMLRAAFEPRGALVNKARKLAGSALDVPFFARMNLPYVLIRCGLEEEGRMQMEGILNTDGPVRGGYLLARAYVAANEFDRAVEILKLAHGKRFVGWLPMALRWPELLPLLKYPEIVAMHGAVFASVPDTESGATPPWHRSRAAPA